MGDVARTRKLTADVVQEAKVDEDAEGGAHVNECAVFDVLDATLFFDAIKKKVTGVPQPFWLKPCAWLFLPTRSLY